MTPLVSVITAAYHRPLDRAVDSVRGQSYPKIEHIIVVDDHEQAEHFDGVVVVNLGRNWQSVTEHWGSIPRVVGGYLARGEFVCYLDDDNAYLPRHVETLVGLLMAEGADCAAAAQERRDWGGVILHPKLEDCQIDTSQVMHRTELLGTNTWRPVGTRNDWDLFSRWRDRRWVFTDEVTSVFGP